MTEKVRKIRSAVVAAAVGFAVVGGSGLITPAVANAQTLPQGAAEIECGLHVAWTNQWEYGNCTDRPLLVQISKRHVLGGSWRTSNHCIAAGSSPAFGDARQYEVKANVLAGPCVPR